MIVPVLALSLIFQAQGEPQIPSLYKAYVPSPTGHNGYEEYLQAADIIRTRACQKALGDMASTPPGDEAWLASRRAVVAAAAGVRDLVITGNGKQVRNPRSNMDWDATFAELPALRQVCQVLAVQANVQVIDGQPVQAAQTLEAALRFASKLQGTGFLLGYLVGVSCQSTTLAAINERLGDIPLPSLKPLMVAASESLDSDCLKRALTGEANDGIHLLRSFPRNKMADFYSVGDLSENSDPEYIRVTLNKMPAAEYAAKLDQASQVAAGQFQALLAILPKPESEWSQALAEVESKRIKPKDEIVAWLSELLTVAASQVFSTEVRRRTQLRILKLHLAIRDRKLTTSLLPKSLSDLKGVSAFDPLSNSEFVYARRGSTYDLYSSGGMGLGRIDLVYKRQREDDGPGGP